MKAAPERPRMRRGLKVAAASVAVAVFFASGVAVGFDRSSADHLFPGTRIGGVRVGSSSVAEASAMVRAKLLPTLHRPIQLHAPRLTLDVDAWKLGMRFDVEKAVRRTLADQHSTPFFSRMWRRIWGDERNISVAPALDKNRLHDVVRGIATRVNRDVRDARVEVRGDELKVFPHQVGRDMSIWRSERHIVKMLGQGKTNIGLPVVTTWPAITTEAFHKTILVRTISNTLTYYEDGQVKKRYGVATGTGGYPTPHGQFRITLKRMNPSWVNPHTDWSEGMPEVIPPGPNNPLGTRALNLSASGIRIHGTPDDSSIGSNASHGCIRMHIHDSEELFGLADVGTPVVIIPA
jgi:lipoprotein-anchoring transpeptidase ErfK/SrfK